MSGQAHRRLHGIDAAVDEEQRVEARQQHVAQQLGAALWGSTMLHMPLTSGDW
jgi:hypothetical protein